LILGTAAFGQAYGISNSTTAMQDQEIKPLLEFCLKNKINTLDTARDYDDSEIRLGEIGVEKFLVITKIFCDENYKKGDMERKVRSSLQRLRIQKCDGVLIHNGEALQSPLGELLAIELRALVDLGLTEKVGFSTYDPKEADITLSRFRLDIVQTPMSLFDRRVVEGGFIDKWRLKKIEIHLRSVFLQGLLLKDPKKTLKNPDSAPLEECEKYRNTCRLNKINPLDGCLSYVFKNAPGARVVVGPISAQEMKQISEFKMIEVSAEKEVMPPWNSKFDPRNWN
jgi:aryl-alcohol dehydrogenase-like predicted oxidoreductase